MIFAAGFRFDERKIHFAVDQDIRSAAEQAIERVVKARTRAIAFIVRMQNQYLRISDFRAKILRSEHEFALLNANGMHARRLQNLARAVRKAINAAAALFLFHRSSPNQRSAQSSRCRDGKERMPWLSLPLSENGPSRT